MGWITQLNRINHFQLFVVGKRFALDRGMSLHKATQNEINRLSRICRKAIRGGEVEIAATLARILFRILSPSAK